MPPTNRAAGLAQRLRALREDAVITQPELARALGVSVPAVSSWESKTNPRVPPVDRLAAYAMIFATRTGDGGAVQVASEAALTDEQRALRDDLRRELLALRERALADPGGEAEISTVKANSPWDFGNARITIVCAPMPPGHLDRVRYTDPEDPNYIEAYRYADLDALLELYGYLKELNPGSDIVIRVPATLEPHDYTNHLVLLGGVDWNLLTRELLDGLDVPVSQVTRETDDTPGYFEVTGDTETVTYRPVVRQEEQQGRAKLVLLEDVAHFFRGPNPFNHRRTVTLCNGMYGRGVLGAVRTLTDGTFRQRNADYLVERFAGSDQYSILSRVRVVNGKVLTPDWTVPATRLHEWPEAGA